MDNIVDIFTRHGHFVERYKTGQFKRFGPFLQRVRADLIRQLGTSNTIRSQRLIRNKLKNIENMVQFHFSEFTTAFDEQLDMFAESEARFGLKALGNDFEAPLPSLARLKTAINSRPFNNRLLKQTLRDFSKDQARLIRNAVSNGFFTSQTIPEIIDSVIGTAANRFQDGALQVSRTAASRLVRTSINHVAAVAKDTLYKENSDLISHYEWVSTLDGRTSDICVDLNENVYRVGKGRLPPAHPNCRSTTAPIMIGDAKIKESL